MSRRNTRSRNNSENRSRSFGGRNQSRGGGGGGGYNSGPRTPVELHDVTCAKCGTATQVPFKPDGTRPVYCRDCYQKQKPSRY